jgi:hypothetical protein
MGRIPVLPRAFKQLAPRHAMMTWRLMSFDILYTSLPLGDMGQLAGVTSYRQVTPELRLGLSGMTRNKVHS